MNAFRRPTRATAAVALAAAVLSLVGSGTHANAAPSRSATVFTDNTYLQDALGLPVGDTTPAIETVTYDRFQWLLEQSGNFAFLIGDPADTNFKARAQDVEAAALAAGVKKVYWFDPVLAGGATKVGTVTEPNLDTRNPASIGLAAASQNLYGTAWTSLVAQYLGNGYGTTTLIKATTPGINSEGGTVVTAANNAVVNDSTNPIFDYRTTGNAQGAGTTPNDDYFFVYNKAHVDGSSNPDKILSSVDLTTETTSAQTVTDVTTALAAVPGGAANATELGQGAFWQSQVNAKYGADQPEPALNPTANAANAGGSDQVLTDADVADWRIKQITYPQLVHLLNSATAQNAIILFGGTWCPNTRAALQSINSYAIDNNVPVVYNFDTVLDGGTINNGTTSATDPFQTRNASANGATANSNPSYLYGDLEASYLANIATEYDPTRGNGSVTYYSGGDTTKALSTVKKLQVPFLIGFQKGASTATTKGGVTRQWIQQKTDVSGLPYFTEYMSEPYYTHPQPNALALKIPHDAAIWSTINSDLSTFTATSNPAAPAITSHYNTGTDTDDASYLSSAEVANFTYSSTANSGAGSVTAAVSNPGTAVGTINPGVSGSTILSVSPAALSAAQTALGANSPTTKAAAGTAMLAAEKAASPDAATITNLATVYAAFSVAQSRKTSILGVWSSVQFGLEAVAKLGTFFGGLPGGVVTQRTVTANDVDADTAPVINLAIANDYGRVPVGTVALTVTKGGSTVYTANQAVAQNAVSFTLPTQAEGSYGYTLSYAGDDQIAAFTETGTFDVTAVPATSTQVVTTTAPKYGQAPVVAVTIGNDAGKNPTGDVQLVVKKGNTVVLTTSKAVASNRAAFTLPKYTAGVYGLTFKYVGDSQINGFTKTGAVTVAKAKVTKAAGATTKAPTSKAAGTYKVTVTTVAGLAHATGKVTVKVKHGTTTKTLTGTLVNGAVVIAVPKLAKGTWTVAISYPGDVNYLAATAAGASIKVVK